tara:strand:+ start:591 stop:1019 length:429 start_codon:yes stop_codon:yes gene_type:complete
MKKGPFKLKSGNKPSMAKLAGVSPMKDTTKSYKEPTDEEKKQAIIKGKIANWNKKNPNATQEEMNAYIASLKIDDIKLPAPTRKMEPKVGAVGAKMYDKLTKKKTEPKFNFTGKGKFDFNKRFNFTGGQDDPRYRGNYDEVD